MTVLFLFNSLQSPFTLLRAIHVAAENHRTPCPKEFRIVIKEVFVRPPSHYKVSGKLKLTAPSYPSNQMAKLLKMGKDFLWHGNSVLFEQAKCHSMSFAVEYGDKAMTEFIVETCRDEKNGV